MSPAGSEARSVFWLVELLVDVHDILLANWLSLVCYGHDVSSLQPYFYQKLWLVKGKICGVKSSKGGYFIFL